LILVSILIQARSRVVKGRLAIWSAIRDVLWARSWSENVK